MSDPAPDSNRGERRIPERRASAWAAFNYRDFRLLWSGLLVSQMGQWMQFTSLTYFIGVVLLNSQSHGSLGLGLLGAARCIPVLLFSPIAGFVADRFPRRRTLILTNFAVAMLALALAFVSQARGPWVLPVVLAIAGAIAGVQCFDSPARQSWVSFMVPRSVLSNAIGLSSVARNVPLMVGPAIAGILIGTVGVYASFFVQAVTQWAVVVAVLLMKPVEVSHAPREPMLKDIITGVRFLLSHAVLRWLMLVLLITCLCVRPYTWLLAAFAGHVLHVDASAYGMMLAVGGIGTVCGALTTAIYQTENRGRVWFISGIFVASGLFALGFVHNFYVAIALLAMMGWGTMTFTSSSNVLVQILSPDDMRGRTMSIFTMIMAGLVPAGTMILGAIASQLGLSTAYAIGGAVAAIVGVWVWVRHPVLRSA